MSETVIQVDKLVAGYGAEPVLRGVSLSLHDGERLAVIGPNGAGKTTLLRCLIGLHEPSQGSVSVLGRDVSRSTRREHAANVAYVPQTSDPALPFTVREVVMMGRYPHLSAFTSVKREDRAAVELALSRMDLLDLAGRAFGTLSGGERQRVMVAAALAQDARILVLDEPGAYLDPHHQLAMMELLLQVSEAAGTALVWVTHDVNLAALFSNRILALQHGEVKACGIPAQVMKAELLDGLFGHAFRYIRHPDVELNMVVPGALSQVDQSQ